VRSVIGFITHWFIGVRVNDTRVMRDPREIIAIFPRFYLSINNAAIRRVSMASTNTLERF